MKIICHLASKTMHCNQTQRYVEILAMMFIAYWTEIDRSWIPQESLYILRPYVDESKNDDSPFCFRVTDVERNLFVGAAALRYSVFSDKIAKFRARPGSNKKR